MLLIFIVLLAISASFLNALAAVIQRYESSQTQSHELFRRNLIKGLIRNRKWIAGLGIEIFAFFCQAAALRKGALIVVQPLMTLDLVFLMLILHYKKNIPVGKREWIAIAMICLGLSGMLISANPHAGQKPYALSSLLLVVIVIAIVILISIYIVRRNASSSIRAGVSGLAAGFTFALSAVFTKIITRQLGYGFLFILSHWQVWALLAVGIVSLVMSQNTYAAGPVAVSQPSMEISELTISIALGIYLFGDTINLGATNLFFATITGAIAAIGIALLGHSKRLQIQGY